MLESVVGQWAGSTPLKKAKCTIVVYSIDEFISSQLSWTSAFPIMEDAILLAQAWHAGVAGVLRPLDTAACYSERHNHGKEGKQSLDCSPEKMVGKNANYFRLSSIYQVSVITTEGSFRSCLFR